MESWKNLIISITLIALFSYGLINMAFNLQDTNNINNTILDDSTLSSFNDTLISDLNKVKSDSEEYWNASREDQTQEQNPEGALTLSSIFHSLTTFAGFIFSAGGNLIGILIRLGADSVVLNILIALLTILGIVLFWRFYKLAS